MLRAVHAALVPRSVASSVDELLAGATARTPLAAGDAKSGSMLERVVIDGQPMVLKHLHPDEDWTMQSDHGVFHQAGIPFVYFGVEDHADYHQPTDTAVRINSDFFAKAAAVVLDAMRALDVGLR